MAYGNGLVNIGEDMVRETDTPADVPGTTLRLSNLTDTELIALRDQIPAEIMRRLDAIDKHTAVLRGAVSPVNVAAAPSKRVHPAKGGTIPVKYRDEQGNTWSGRGVKPLWLQAAIKAGAALDMFKVGAVQ